MNQRKLESCPNPTRGACVTLMLGAILQLAGSACAAE